MQSGTDEHNASAYPSAWSMIGSNCELESLGPSCVIVREKNTVGMCCLSCMHNGATKTIDPGRG